MRIRTCLMLSSPLLSLLILSGCDSGAETQPQIEPPPKAALPPGEAPKKQQTQLGPTGIVP